MVGDSAAGSSELNHSPEELFFRVVMSNGERKGLRLERVFWSLLEQAAREQNLTLADIVKLAPDGNLSSHMRTYAASWASRNLGNAREASSFAQFSVTLNACPTPAFAISADRRLRIFNPAFHRYVRRHIPSEDIDASPKNLRLQIDTAATELIAQLKQSREAVINVGFTFGLNERRVRGRLNTMLAPVWNEELIGAYVVD